MTLSTRSGIPTTYRETRFRSRLEARWAAFFDLVGWRWTYEPFDADGWIPDFLIHGGSPLLVEIGPVATEAEFTDKAAKPLAHLERPTLVLGVSPLTLGDDTGWEVGYCGYLVNETPGFAGLAFWTFGGPPDRLSVFQDATIHYPQRATWEERHHPTADDVRWLDDLWRQAGNVVQWHRQ